MHQLTFKNPTTIGAYDITRNLPSMLNLHEEGKAIEGYADLFEGHE